MSEGISISPRRWRVLLAARRKAARWLHRAGVVSVGIGVRRHRGRTCDEPCIVVTVDHKLGSEAIARAGRRPFPRWLEVVVDDQRGRVRVDVQHSGGQRAAKHQGLTGAPVSHAGKMVGAVSAVVWAGQQRALLISGHVAKQRGRTMTVGALRGVTREPVRNEWLDHCVVDVVGEEKRLANSAGGLVDGTAIAGVREPDTLRLREELFFHHAATGERRAVRLQDLDVAAWIEGPGGDVRMRDLITTEAATVAGDSGTLLFDAAFRAVATLVGVLGDKSYFIPCKRALAALDLELAVKDRP